VRKIFYTERDIEDMAARGERTLVVTEDIVLTDLAYECANKLGITLTQLNDTPPAAPIRPYLNMIAKPSNVSTDMTLQSGGETLKQHVKNAVKERLGSQLNNALLERIIERVFHEIGLG